MTVYRQAKKEEYADLVELANYVFKLDFEQLLPKAFNKNAKTHNITKVAQTKEGKLIAEVCVLPQDLKVGDCPLKSNYLGTVSVHPQHRGRGHMKALMNLCIDEMQGKYDLSVLGGQRQRYEYFGYTYGGVQWEYNINIHNIRHTLKDVDSSGISFADLIDLKNGVEHAVKLNEDRIVNICRPLELIDRIVVSYNQAAIAVLHGGECIGYILTGNKNAEISEFALNSYADTKRVLKAFFEHFGVDTTTVVLPEYETALHKELSDFAESYKTIPCCMFNIFDFANVIKAFLTVKNQYQKLSYGTVSVIMDGQPVTIIVDENGVRVENTAGEAAPVLNKMDAQKLILTPFGRYMDIDIPTDWFPLPLFWYVVDCF